MDPDADRAAFPAAVRLHSDVTSDALPAGAHVLVATMDERDVAAVQRALALAPAYLGVIASRKRFAELRRTLAERGVAEGVLDAIIAPAGLDIGARTPEEIAISVMAQMVERMHRGAAASSNALVAPRDQPREAIDPVCGMAVAIAGARHHAEVEGVAYYFCCAGCRATFVADPARFGARSEPAPGP